MQVLGSTRGSISKNRTLVPRIFRGLPCSGGMPRLGCLKGPWVIRAGAARARGSCTVGQYILILAMVQCKVDPYCQACSVFCNRVDPAVCSCSCCARETTFAAWLGKHGIPSVGLNDRFARARQRSSHRIGLHIFTAVKTAKASEASSHENVELRWIFCCASIAVRRCSSEASRQPQFPTDWQQPEPQQLCE